MAFAGFIHKVSSLISGLAPFHLLAYSTLLGTELYQSFVMTKVCYQALPRSAFTTLQKRVFPIYFRGQSLFLVLAALTVPPYGPVSLVQNRLDWIPFMVAGVTAALNMIVYGPRTQQAMINRIHQETRDGLVYGTVSSVDNVSEDMKILSRAFSKNHAMSIHLNLISIIATLFYGWRLASRFEIKAK